MCLPGWTIFEGTCFRRVDTEIKGEQLGTLCESLKKSASHKAIGATILKVETNRFLLDKFVRTGTGKSTYWIGLIFSGENQDWSWVDGSTVDYANWMTGHPKKGYYCARMSKDDGKWESLPCNKRTNPYICQYLPSGMLTSIFFCFNAKYFIDLFIFISIY